MQIYSASKAAGMVGLEGFTLRGWCREGYVEPLIARTDERYVFTPADVALLAVMKALTDFGFTVPLAYARAREALPDLSPTSDAQDVIAYAKGRRMSCTRTGEVTVAERFPKVVGAMLLVEIGDVVSDALNRR